MMITCGKTVTHKTLKKGVWYEIGVLMLTQGVKFPPFLYKKNNLLGLGQKTLKTIKTKNHSNHLDIRKTQQVSE